MTNARASAAHILRRAARAARALRDDARASAAVEAALILPIALTMFALLIFGAEAFAIQRKVTLTARTVTDLVTQASPSKISSGASVVTASSTLNLLCAASAVIQPYNSTNLSMVVSEVKVNSDGATSSDGLTALVQWSEPYNGATARTLSQKITLPTGLGVGQAGNYLVLGEAYYNFTPINLFTPISAMTLHDSIYLTPRQSTSISCTDCATHS